MKLPQLAAISLLAMLSACGDQAPSPEGSLQGKDDIKAISARGEALFAANCASCHDNPQGRIPPHAALAYRSPDSIVQTLTHGSMRPMASGLDAGGIRAISAYLTGRLPRPVTKESNYQCAQPAPPVAIGKDDWPVIGRDNWNGRYQATAGIAEADVPRLKLKWAFAYPGGAPGPAVVASKRIFLSTGDGRIMALDAATGCRYWDYKAGGIIRNVSVGTPSLPGYDPMVVFGDDKGVIKALDARTGKLRWTTPVEEHVLARITAHPIVWRDRVLVPISSIEDPLSHDPTYECCTSQGGVAALDVATGRLLWKGQTLPRPATIVDAGAPKGKRRYGPAGGSVYTPLTIDAARGYVYAATAESYDLNNPPGAYSVIAFDLKTGKRAWVQQLLPDAATRAKLCKAVGDDECRNMFSMSAPVLLHRLPNGREILVVSSKSGMLYALDPNLNGKVVWSTKLAAGGSMGGLMYGPAADSHNLYVPISELEAVPPAKPGGLVAVDPATGAIKWRRPGIETACSWPGQGCSGAQAAAATAIPGAVFSPAWDGHLRAYAAKDGALLWDFDTARPVKGVNGLEARGGQVAGWPTVVVDGHVYVTSGASSMARPGNALLVFTVDGK